MEPARPRHGAVLITQRDREVLAFLARHRLVEADHVAALLSVSRERAADVLARLARGGYVYKQEVYHQRAACYRIERKGLAVIGSRLGPPGRDMREYEHDVGVAWLWLAAHTGAFGSLRGLVAERQLRSHDASPERSAPPLAVALGGVGPGGRERLHYPDLVLRRSDGHTIALELELNAKSRTRLERILAGYGADPRYDCVLYLVPNASLGRAVIAAAERLGVRSLVHVQFVEFECARGRAGPTRAVERVRTGVSSAAPRAREHAR